MDFPVLSDFDLSGKRVLLRVDINSPMEPTRGEILDDTRLRGHLPTIKALEGSKTAILAHQSRPGRRDFTTLEVHAKKLGQLLGKDVKYAADIFGPVAQEEIKSLRDGEVLMLENVRFCSEEVSDDVKEMPPKEQVGTHLVQKLSSNMDFYVNDAFAVSHRNQPSIVGFPMVLPSCAGMLMEKEVSILSKVTDSKDRPRVFAFGGAKAVDAIDIIGKVLERNIADLVLASGVVGNIFLFANGRDLGKTNWDFIAAKRLDGLVPRAKEIMKRHPGKVVPPIDLAFKKNGARVEASAKKFPDQKILDIGIETIVQFSSLIKEAKVLAANGPCGVFEQESFSLGTEELLKAVANSRAYSVIGGGHLSAIAQSKGLTDNFSYISTGGKATMAFLAKDKLPGIEVLKDARRK